MGSTATAPPGERASYAYALSEAERRGKRKALAAMAELVRPALAREVEVGRDFHPPRKATPEPRGHG